MSLICKSIDCGAVLVDNSQDFCIDCREEQQETNPLLTQVGGSHYKELVIQPIEYIHANGIPFAEGSIIKYVTRWRSKNGIADLEKAKHFLELLIALETKNPF